MDSPWKRSDWVAFVTLFVIVIGSLPLLTHPWYDATNDGSLYIVLARELAAGHEYTHLGESFVVRPPGFPLLIAAMLQAVGQDFFWMNALVGSIGAIGVLLLFVYVRPHLRGFLACGVSLAIWLNPRYRELCNQTMSDVPAAAILLACLLSAGWAARRPGIWRELAPALCVALLLHVRTACAPIVPAIVIARLCTAWAAGPSQLRFGLKHIGAFLGLLAIFISPWAVYSRVNAPAPPSNQTLVHSYTSASLRVDPGDPKSSRLSLSKILERVPLQMRNITASLGTRMTDVTPLGYWLPRLNAIAIVVTLVLLLSTATVLARRRGAAEWFVFGTLALLLPYFGFGIRFMLPIYMLALPCTIEIVRDLLAVRLSEHQATIATGALIVVLIAVDWNPRPLWPEIEERHQRLTSTAASVEAKLPFDTRLASRFGAHYSVYLNRPVHSLIYAANRMGDERGIESIIDTNDLNTVILAADERRLTKYFKSRYGKGTAAGNARLWRVRGDDR